MVIVSHPTGNAFVRAVLDGLSAYELLEEFHTTLAIRESDLLVDLLPEAFSKELLRRHFGGGKRIVVHPVREIIRLIAPKIGLKFLTRHESPWASTDAVYRDLDSKVARRLSYLAQKSTPVKGVYCYEDAARDTFMTAKEFGIKCFYDLPIAYWHTVQRLLKEEAERLPNWEPTLGGTRDSAEKLERKTEEALLADAIICPSKFVLNSLPQALRDKKACLVAEFGTPDVIIPERRTVAHKRPLQVLFAGSMGQRKGLADLFAAMQLLKRDDVELIVMGTPVVPASFYRRQFGHYKWEQPRPHHEVLRLMQTCDIFVLPSIVEGRALVQQEAMLCGLPLIATANAGGEDLIEAGKTGFLVPIRSPEAIAEKITWFADHRDELEEMRIFARQKAMTITWDNYRRVILETILPMIDEGEPS